MTIHNRPGIFPSLSKALPYLLAFVLFWLITAYAVFAQEATSGSASQAAAGAQSAAGAVAGSQAALILNQNAPSRAQTDIEYQGSYRVESAPNVSAPAVFGGGHPCLAGRSGGVSIVGGGFSYGQGNPEPACMAWIMGQPEAAIRIMMMKDPTFCKAMASVGYARIGNTRSPVTCDGKGLRTAASAKAPTRTKEQPALLTKCERNGNEVRIAYTATGRKNKELAKSTCLRSLGF